MSIERCRSGLAGAVRLALILVILASIFALPAFAQDTTVTPAATAAPVEPPDALAGRQSFADNCAACHGTAGNGDGVSAQQLGFPPTVFADPGVADAMSPAEMFNVAKSGRMERMMPPWGGRLTDQQIWDTVGYAWTLHTSADEVNKGKAVYEANCASCHGPDGKGQPGMLDFTDFNATAAISQTAWAQVLANGRGSMPAFGQQLDAASQSAALEYVRSLSFKQEFRGPLTPGTGVITGTVTNGTLGKPMGNLTVTLRIFDGTTDLESRDAATGANGEYRFDKLPTDPTLSYAVTAQYPAGFPYGTDVISFQEGESNLALPLTVYETTTDGTGIHAERVHFIVEFDSGQLLVAELIVFGLDGNRTYIGDGNHVLTIPLPKGAQDLAISDSGQNNRFQAIGDGFVDTLPLPPGSGSRQLLFRYTLPYTGQSLDLVRSLPYPVTDVNALISDQGEKVTSPQLTDQGVRQTQNGNYLNLTGNDLPANQQITLSFTNLPAPGAVTATTGAGAPIAAGSDSTLLLVVIGAVGFAAVLLASWPLLRRRTLATGNAGPVLQGREALVDALAQLDLAHQAGEVPDTAYRTSGYVSRRSSATSSARKSGRQACPQMTDGAMAANPGVRKGAADEAILGAHVTSTAAAPAMIELRKLTKAFGRKVVLRGIDLTVGAGESLVIFGPNGAGKTTLMRILASLSRPSSGTVHIGGLDMATHSDGIRRHLGLVSHAPLLYDSLTGEENLRFFARLYRMPDPGPRIMSLLEQVGLVRRRGDLVRTYSRGMVQRLAIARALLHDPQVLLLDEPDTGLDPQAAEMLHHLLAKLGNHTTGEVAGSDGVATTPSEGSSFGRTIVTITHSIERGLAIADRVAIIANGRVVYEADAAGLGSTDFRPIYDHYVGDSR